MNNTDNRVVSLRFDNTGFAQKISQARQGLQKLNDDLKLKGTEEGSSRIESFFDTIKSAVKKIDLEPIDKSIEKTESSFKALEVVAVGALLNIGTKISDLGIKMAKSMSIDQVKAGFDKYEQLLKSTQTILATDENLTQDFVNEQLKKLTWYTDETSYAMTDMVSNISQFTNMGIALEDAVQDMIGIGNAAGMAGASVSQASHAMAGFSKAMATGYMSKQIWSTWIKNSSIGTMEFKKQAIEAALALGTLKKSQDGTLYSANGKVFDVTAENFDETLSKGKWFTTAVMEATLKRYSKAMDQLYAEYEKTGKATSKIIEEMGGDLDAFSVKAFRLAQEATTFTQAVDSLFDAMSSRWSEIITLIFGDYEQAKVLWTDLANWLYDTFMTPVDNLLEKIEAWSNTFIRFTKDVESGVTTVVTARDELISAFKNLFGFLYSSEDKVKSVMSSIAEAWSDVFGETPLEYLIELTIRFKKWTDKLYNNEQIMDRIKRIATDIFKVLKLVKSIIFAIGNILRKVVWPIVKSILGFVLNVAETIFTIISGIASGISGALDGIFGSKQKITKIEQITKDTTDAIRESKDAIKEATKAMEEAEEEMDDASDSTDKATKKTKKATEATEEYTSALEKAIKEGKTFSDENYIYTKEGLQIPKHVQINPNSMAGQLQKLIQAIKSIGTGTTEVEKNIQNSFKGIGKNVEKTVKKVSSTIKTISKNSLLYKSSEGIRKVTNKLFTGLDRSFERSKNNIIGFSRGLKNMFSLFHRNKKVSSALPGVSKSSLNLSKAISKTNKKSSDTIQGIAKNTKSLIDVYDEASKEPDKMTKIGNGVSNAISGTLGYATTKILQKVLKLVGEETETIDKKTEITDKKIKEMSQKLGSAIAKGVTSISWNKVKEVFLNIWEIIKNMGKAIKEFFSIFKEGNNMMSSSSSSSMEKVEKKSKTIWDIFNGIVKSVSDFTNKIKNSVKSFSVYDKKTGELKSGFAALKKVAEGIRSAFYYVLEFIMTIGYAIKRISFSDIINKLTQFSEWFKNTKIGKWFSTLFGWINQLKEDINEFGFKQAFDNFFTHIWTRIKLFAHDVKEAIVGAFEKINTDEWWKKLDSSKAYTVVSKLVSNLTGILTKAVKFALSEVVDIIFANVSSFLVIGSNDLSDSFRHAFTEVNGEMVELSTWDKLKYIFENVFSGALFNNLLYTKAGSFIKWFTDTLFSSIGSKITSIKTAFENIFKRNKKDDNEATSYMTSEIDTKGMSKVAADVKELQLENNEGINWDKILGGTIFMFTVARIVSAWKYFIKHTAGDKSGVTSIASSIKEIGTSFATIAAGTTILAILSFSAALYIFVKAMETISELNADKLQKNVEAISGLLAKFAGFIFTLTTVVAFIQVLMSSFDLAKITKTGNVFGSNAPRGAGLFGVAAIVFSIAAGVAALGYALSKLSEVDTDKMKEAVTQIKPIFYRLLIAIGIIVAIAGFLGFLTAKNTKVPTSIDMGKFNMGNVFQSITNKSPLAGVPELVKNISLMILSLVGAFLGLVAVIWIMHKTIGENETDVLIAKAGAMLGGILLFIVLILGLLLAGINEIAKNAGTQNIAKILGNFAWIMASLGLAISLMFLSIAVLIHRISDAFSQNETTDDVSMMIFTITIMVMVFGAIMYIINQMMDSILQMASMVNGSEQKGKNMQKVLKAFAKVIKSIISPFKWIFAGIGLMVKLMSDADGKTLLSAVAIVGIVMGAVVLMMKELAKILEMVLQQVATSKNNVSSKGAESLTTLFKAIRSILLVIFGAVILIVGLVTLLAGVIDRMENPERMGTAIGIIGIIMGGIIISLAAVIGAIALLKKINIDGKQLWSMTGALILFLGVVALLAAGMFAAMMLMLNKVGDNPEAFKEAGLSVLAVFGAIFLLIALFAGYIVLLDKVKVDWKKFIVFTLGLIAFAGSIVILAYAFKMMTDAMSTLQDGDFSKIVGLLAGFVAILAILGALTAIPGFGTSFAIGMIAVALAFDLFAAAIVLLSMAFGIFVVSFERFFDTMLRLPELIPAWQAFLKGLREQVVPELQGLLLALQNMAFTLIEGFMRGIWNLILEGLRYWSEHAAEPVDLIITGIVAIIDGLANGATRIDTALTNLFTTIGNIIERHWNNLVARVQGWFDNISDNAVVGFIQGIGSRIGDLWNSGEEMGDAVKEGAQDSLDSHSPSRWMEWLGKMAIKGFEKGLGNKEEQTGLYKTAASLKEKLSEALSGDGEEGGGLLDGLKEKVQSFMDSQDFTATIKGVLDMDEMMEQMNSLDTESLMGGMDMSSMMNSMDTSSLMGDTASAFSDMKMSTDASALMNQNGTGDVYNVTTMEQNNYSPKSLDAATQYRQTNNLVDNSLRQTGTTSGGHAMYGHRESRRVDTGRVTAGGRPIYVYKK